MKKGISFLAAMILPVLAFASEEGGGHHGWFSPIWGIPAVVWQFINLTLVAGLFYYLLRWRLPNVLRKRTVEIESALETARKEKKESLAKLKELEDKMARLEDEVAKIETEARGAAEREKARLTDEARKSAEWLRKEADDEFSRREREAERRLRAIAVDEALRLAREQVRGAMRPEDEERLIGLFSKDIRDRADG
ncbi:MAG TPA: ATP synthase F0 subunit B [Acidobacteriota bacterium]|nr:ATP synthase F0 subunit B [Acidobacteriota bacterium]HNT17491.1 ATP synthase F0 subunit B [Acidobacteriota bacterium]HPA27773.1 ATP synthase F0 subunit B [Acidobacteriota bacterium]HQO20502.1 ATP synthase F0 subunit B [Acidobacteriota bacterium]HQQ46727.1 ATP synthase F0 subunit B [Acidobacteriota bacterium]